MESVTEHRVQIAGHVTRALEVDGDGPGIVLLHGWSDSADTWRPLLAELAERGRRAIAVDLPGFGDATPLQPGAVLPQLDAFANEVALSWAGERAGRRRGHVARRLPGAAAGRAPGRAAAGRRRPGRARRARAAVVVRPDRGGPDGPAPALDPGRRCPGELVRRAQAAAYRQLALTHPSETQKAVVDAFSRSGETRADVAALLESGRALAPELSTAPFDLVGIRCPVLLVWGAHDRMLPHTDARMALDALPTTQVELIEDAGPHPQLDATRRLAELLLPFGT